MMLRKTLMALAAVVLVSLGTDWAVHRFHKPGQLDVLTAQAMDMSEMRPPTGAAPVALASARRGSLGDTVTYTGSVLAYNEQDISPRITGTLTSLPVYPGDSVRAGQVVAQLDTSGVAPQAAQAAAQARSAGIGQQVVSPIQVQAKQAAEIQALAQVQAARQGVTDAQAEAQADQAAIADALAGTQSAQAGADYWRVEIAREKQLADAGAVSQQEYQNELSQAQAADAALAQAQAKVAQARATAAAARAQVSQARRQVDVALAGVRMAQADISVAQGQAVQAGADAQSALAAARAAQAQQGYARIVSPAAGLVTARPVAPGTLVQPGTVILKVAEIDQVRVQANVAVEDVAGIHVGSPVRITVQGDSSQPIRTAVTSVFPSADPQTRTAIVEAVVTNPGHRLLPGAFVTMQITKNVVSGALLVPASALVYQGGQAYVWTAGGSAPAPTPVQYKAHCGLVYTASFAAAHHYVCPMDHLPLTRMASAASAPPGGPTAAHEVAVQAGASDGAWTQVSADALGPGARVVTHGQAGLTDGADVVATAWGADGPQTLPSAAAASQGQTLYRCEKCGLTFSAADAKRHNYIDPMDGGKLVPVAPAGMPGMKM